MSSATFHDFHKMVSYSYRLLFLILGTLHGCSPESLKKADPSPSKSPLIENIEKIEQLKIMSTPPQKWLLEIGTGQKDMKTQQYVFESLQWHNENWRFKSKTAVQKNQNSNAFLFNVIYGETTPQRLNLEANNSIFNSVNGSLEGNTLSVKSHNNSWKLSAEHYQSSYPWSILRLKKVKGTFQR